MLRNRSRAVTSKQAIMADHSSLPSPTQNQTRSISSFLGSPRFFNGFLAKSISDSETVMTPTSFLETKKIPNFNDPFGYDKTLSKPLKSFSENKNLYEKLDSEAIGLALVDSLLTEKDDDFSKSNSRMVLFGSKLKIQIPSLPPSVLSPSGSPKSPADFGIKTRNSQVLVPFSPFGSVKSGIQTKESPHTFTGALSLSDMELSEDYTCVISHGPNPKTIHIYDNCIVENCCGVVGLSEMKNQYRFSKSPSVNFLNFCYTCKKNLEEGKDIYMYRGEKAFCSNECRRQEMLFDGVENSELGGAFRT